MPLSISDIYSNCIRVGAPFSENALAVADDMLKGISRIVEGGGGQLGEAVQQDQSSGEQNISAGLISFSEALFCRPLQKNLLCNSVSIDLYNHACELMRHP